MYGDNWQVYTLRRFGAKASGGLDRKPRFVSGLKAIHCIAMNAWRAGEANGEFNKHIKTDYRGYRSSKEFTSNAICNLRVAEEIAKIIGREQEGALHGVSSAEANDTRVLTDETGGISMQRDHQEK